MSGFKPDYWYIFLLSYACLIDLSCCHFSDSCTVSGYSGMATGPFWSSLASCTLPHLVCISSMSHVYSFYLKAIFSHFYPVDCGRVETWDSHLVKNQCQSRRSILVHLYRSKYPHYPFHRFPINANALPTSKHSCAPKSRILFHLCYVCWISFPVLDSGAGLPSQLCIKQRGSTLYPSTLSTSTSKSQVILISSGR